MQIMVMLKTFSRFHTYLDIITMFFKHYLQNSGQSCDYLTLQVSNKLLKNPFQINFDCRKSLFC